MKSLALIAALMIGTAAVAQTATPPADPTMPTAPAPDTTTPPGPDAAPPPPPPDPQAGATLPGNMTAPPAAQASYPRCSATVTDQCRQSSARESDWKGGPPKHRKRHG